MNRTTDNTISHTANAAGRTADATIKYTADTCTEHTAGTFANAAANRIMEAATDTSVPCPVPNNTDKGMAPTENDNRNHTLTVHHIGYLVKKIEKAIAGFQHLGYTVRQDTALDPVRRIHICFMEKDGYVIELVSPAESNSLVSGLMKKYKNSPYHICYETKDLDSELARLTAEGYTAIDTPTPAPALDNRRVVFLMNPYLGMIELLEH